MSDRLAQLTKLHAADPADADLPYMIALEHAKAGRTDDALAWLDKAVALQPHYCYAYFQKAKLLADLGRADEARGTLTAGIDIARRTGNEKAFNELSELLATLA
jgi:tetratricopeptide (TPR) repeat protein